jgi:DNA-binding NtrC family response regulator
LPNAAEAPSPVRDLRPLPLGHGETVLVVDDEREQLLRDEELLAALGYEAVGFLRPIDALAARRRAPRRFDILVVGRVAPAMSAFVVAASLNRAGPVLPIILATASADETDADALAAAGVSDVVHWPIVAAEMAAALERCSAMIKIHGNA